MSRPFPVSFLQALTFGVLLFMALPNLIVLAISFNSEATLAFPPSGLSFEWYLNVFKTPSFAVGLQQSVLLATLNMFAIITIVFVFAALLPWLAPKPKGPIDTSGAH